MSLITAVKKVKPNDVESAVRSGNQVSFHDPMSPRTLCASGASTWSTATTSATKGHDWN